MRFTHNDYPDHLWHNRVKVGLDGYTYAHDLIIKAALDFIRANRARTLFCYLPVTIPHAAMQAPRELYDKYRRLYRQFDDVVSTYSGSRVRNPIAAFPAMMERLDNGVGEVLVLLDELGIESNTVVMFASDNGPHQEGGHGPICNPMNSTVFPLVGIQLVTVMKSLSGAGPVPVTTVSTQLLHGWFRRFFVCRSV